MTDTDLTVDEQIRCAAVREANYFFGFIHTKVEVPVATDLINSNRTPAPQTKKPRLTDVLTVADAIYEYVKTGSKPNDSSNSS